jgi:hypothetical protein
MLGEERLRKYFEAGTGFLLPKPACSYKRKKKFGNSVHVVHNMADYGETVGRRCLKIQGKNLHFVIKYSQFKYAAGIRRDGGGEGEGINPTINNVLTENVLETNSTAQCPCSCRESNSGRPPRS